MHFAIRQTEGTYLAHMAPGAAIRVAIVGKKSHWGKRVSASGFVSMCNNSPVDTGALTTP